MVRGTQRVQLTPGVSFLLTVIPVVLAPPLATYSTLGLISSYAANFPLAQRYIAAKYQRMVTTVTILVIYFYFKRVVRALSRERDRRCLGLDVVEAPSVKTKLPWNLDFIRDGIRARKTGDAFLKYFDTLGHTFNLKLFGADQLFTCDPECIKAVLSTDFNSFEKGGVFKAKMRSVLGVGVFNSDGSMWQLHRSMTRPYFHRERVTHVDLFAQHSDIAISRLLSRLSEPESPAVDIQDLVGRFTLDSATEFLFGSSIHSLNAPLPYPHELPTDESTTFAAAFNRAQEQLMLRFWLAKLWPLFEIWKDKTDESMRVINAFTDPILEERLQFKREGKLKVKNSKIPGDKGDTLLDHLVGFSDGKESIRPPNCTKQISSRADEKVIKDELLNILIAGRDTTAATLTFACYALAMYPACLDKLRAEVLATFGTSQCPNFEELRGMKYLRAFINEVLRVFPPVPFNERTAVRSVVLKSGGQKFYVPKGAQRKDLWGVCGHSYATLASLLTSVQPDADEFDPERWLDERMKKYVTPNPFIFLPFSAGPRIVASGAYISHHFSFAISESSYFIIRLLQRIDQIVLAPEAQPPESLPPSHWQNGPGRKAIEKNWMKSHLTTYASGGLWMRMREASDGGEKAV
ncbi:hypothetical protein FRC10_002230 [Ceratobasidium sp. 414]|nr:hypothetical protein FRC10_002230 [Ceratobasidium sp. 414]